MAQRSNLLIKVWLLLSLLATIFALLIYIVVQQQLRLGANDVPLQLAEDTATSLSQGQNQTDTLLPQQVNIAASLAPFVVIYDESGRPISGSGQLHGQLPALPNGVFAYARRHSDDRITWQPEAGVRVASVVKHFDGSTSGFVMAGQSLREVEKRENLLTFQVLGGWITALLATYLSVAILSQASPKEEKHAPRKN